MAENVTEREDSDGCENSADDNKEMMSPLRDVLECAVCLQTCVHPVQLSCGHIFCYLCVKGVANQSKRCAMCRQEISSDFLDHPQLVRKDDLTNPTAFDDGQQWFYEGRNGWWQYDERTSLELESAFKRGDRSCELLIAGFLYLIDFDNMIQLRRNDPSRKRRIKRDSVTIPKKGVAGLRFRPVIGDIENRETADGEERHLSLTNTVSGANGATALAVHVARSLDMATLPSERVKSSSPTLIPPNNTPQTPHTPSANSGRSSPDISDHSINRAVLEIETLRLDDDEDDDDEEDDDRDSFHELYSSEEEN